MSMNIDFDYSAIKAYQGYLLDNDELLKSSSGGASRALSNAVLNDGGTVFGVIYSSDFYKAHYFCVKEKSDIDKIVGSKYIFTQKRLIYEGQDISVYNAIEKELSKGIIVLFFGLPCDCAAIKKYCTINSIDMSMLYLVDLICLGPTYPYMQELYLKRLEKQYNSKVKSFTVRYKKKRLDTFLCKNSF